MAIRKLLILLCIAVFASFYLFSCKKEKCPPAEILSLNKDTALVPYTALETFKFIIKDSVGNLLDSAIFVGKGKKKYIGDTRTTGSGYGCTGVTDYQAMDYTYQNLKDSTHTLTITITSGSFDSRFEIFLKKLHTSFNWYQGSTSYFYNPQLSVFHDSLIIEKKPFYHVVQLTTPSSNYLSAYFGKYDGLLFLEETHNRIWYKIN